MKIQVLENNMINKIAAGEVVERPVSVVKELVENSIDAGAGVITVEIKDGGISYIRITDNGCGIPQDELKTAFLRHATSKIRSFDDLTNVLTLGFRGEALSSISSVSQVEMVTKTAEAVSGSKIEIHGGQIISSSDTGATTGTTIIMRNLFYNTPARRKFLKSKAVEAGHIHELMQRLCLAHPEISFKFINNNQNVISTNGNGDLKTAVFYVYGKEISKKLIEVFEEAGKLKLSGFVCAPEASRGNRSLGNFFINGRYIKSPVVQTAVEDAYKNRLMAGRFPVYILNMKIEPDCVDVNVHPSKLEVRFENEDEVYSIVINAVKKALEATNLVAEVKWDGAERARKTLLVEEPQVMENVSIADLVYGVKPPVNTTPVINGFNKNNYSQKEISYNDQVFNTAKPPDTEKLPGAEVKEKVNRSTEIELPLKNYAENEKGGLFSDYKIIGQIFGTYWIIEQKEKMYILDQHAVHERVLYEEFINKFKSGDIVSQLLLTPAAIKLAPAETEAVIENVELLKSFGFELEEFGQDIVMLRALPYIFHSPSNTDFFIEIVDSLAGFNRGSASPYEFKLDSIASISCKAAVKANRTLSENECEELVKKLLTLENPFTCPHGRPTIISMSKYEIEKKFGRK